MQEIQPVSRGETRKLNERTYRIDFQPADQKSPWSSSRLTVSVRGGTSLTLEIRDEGWFDRLAKAVGVAREPQTGDTAFDRRFYLRCPASEFAERMFENPAARAAVTALRDLGFRVIRFTGADLEAECARFDRQSRDYRSVAQEAAGYLLQLADLRISFPRPKQEGPKLEVESRENARQSWLGLLAVLFALLGSGLFCAFPPVRFAAFRGSWLIVSAGLAVLYAVVSGLIVRGRSTSHDTWKVVLLCGLVPAPLAGLGTLATINGWRDPGAPIVRILEITGKQIQGGKSTSYLVEVPAWDLPGDTMTYSIDREEFDFVVPGRSRLEVTTYPGRLGVEWYHHKKLMLEGQDPGKRP